MVNITEKIKEYASVHIRVTSYEDADEVYRIEDEMKRTQSRASADRYHLPSTDYL